MKPLCLSFIALMLLSGLACLNANAQVIHHYPAYVRKTYPLTQKLIDLAPKLSGQLISLQQLSAINHDLQLMRTNYRWERGEPNLFSYQLIQTALNALDTAVQFWRDGNDIRYLIGENESYYPFNQAYIQKQLEIVLNCARDLKTLSDLRQTLDKPSMRYQLQPELMTVPHMLPGQLPRLNPSAQSQPSNRLPSTLPSPQLPEHTPGFNPLNVLPRNIQPIYSEK